MVNIFPYWEQAKDLKEAYTLFRDHARQVLDTAKPHGKDVWLGETGWPSSDVGATARNTNNLASSDNAKQYFDKIGCQMLRGNGSGFYYVDWDQDAPASGKPHFGLLDTAGNVLNNIDATCAAFRAEPGVPSGVPKFAGGP